MFQDACGTVDVGAKMKSRKRCVILTLQTHLLSSSACAECCKEEFQTASISILVFLKLILIIESDTKIAITLILGFM